MHTARTWETRMGNETEDRGPECFLRIADKLVCVVLSRHSLLPNLPARSLPVAA